LIVYYFSYRCLIRNSNYLLFGRTWVQARFFFVGFVLVICFLLGPCWSSVFCWVHVGHLFVGSVLVICLLGPCWSSVVCWVRVGHLFFVGSVLVICWFCLVFCVVFLLCLSLFCVFCCPMLPISLDCPFLIAPLFFSLTVLFAFYRK
jgi:hypothetical protein